MKVSNLLFCIAILTGGSAHADQLYQITITNGGPMPISPGILYVTKGDLALTNIGKSATPGLVQLCQTGNPAARLAEIQADPTELSAQQTSTSVVMPGQSVQIQVGLLNPAHAIHFEAMYGETKDTCSIFSVSGRMLKGLSLPGAILSGKDEAVSTGAFADPMVPVMAGAACGSAADAVSCLRALAQSPGSGLVHEFTGYLPSVINLIEQVYGSAQTQALLLPVSGAVKYEITALPSSAQ